MLVWANGLVFCFLAITIPTVEDCASAALTRHSLAYRGALFSLPPWIPFRAVTVAVNLRGGSDGFDPTWDFAGAAVDQAEESSDDSDNQLDGSLKNVGEGLQSLPEHHEPPESGPEEEPNPDAAYLDAVSQQLEPDDWPDDVPGYNHNPFVGVKRPGWFLEEGVDVQSEDPKIRQLNQKLWQACDDGDAALAAELLSQGAEVNAGDPANEWQWTALMHCCAPPPAASVPDAVTADTAKEVERKRMDLVQCLLEHGARVQVTDIYGETPIHYAAVRGYPRLVEQLIEAGVDPFRENQFGCSAQRIAELNQKHNPGCAAAADVIADAGGYDAGWPADEMGREPPGPSRRYREADWARHNEEQYAEEEELPELRESRHERARGINDDLFVRLGGVPPHHMLLPGKDGGPSKVRPEMFEWREEEEKRARVRKELERKAILGEDDDDLDRKKEVWE